MHTQRNSRSLRRYSKNMRSVFIAAISAALRNKGPKPPLRRAVLMLGLLLIVSGCVMAVWSRREAPAAAQSRGDTRDVQTGGKTSEGDKTHRADAARAMFGFNGAGVRIGALSDGVSNLATSQALGDLAPGVVVLPGQNGLGDEGTAMLEIIHDLAPGAQLYFASAFGGVASFAKNIRDLRAAGCDIIVDDVLYYVERLRPSLRTRRSPSDSAIGRCREKSYQSTLALCCPSSRSHPRPSERLRPFQRRAS
jgi:hypothetical protein